MIYGAQSKLSLVQVKSNSLDLNPYSNPPNLIQVIKTVTMIWFILIYSPRFINIRGKLSQVTAKIKTVLITVHLLWHGCNLYWDKREFSIKVIQSKMELWHTNLVSPGSWNLNPINGTKRQLVFTFF